MTPRSRVTCARLTQFCVAAVLCVAPLARAEAAAEITGTATVKTSNGVTSTAPLSVSIDRFSTDADRDAVLAMLKKSGTEGLRGMLLTRPSIGSITLGNMSTAIKYVYERVTPEGRLITAVTSSVIGYVGAGAPGARVKSGLYLGLVILDLKKSGPGEGELVPATKVTIDAKGAIVTDDYSDDVVKLTNVVGK
jgi:hypothetical protein